MVMLHESDIQTKEVLKWTGVHLFHVRRQNIWRNSRRKLAECGPRPGG